MLIVLHPHVLNISPLKLALERIEPEILRRSIFPDSPRTSIATRNTPREQLQSHRCRILKHCQRPKEKT